jgi:predicted Zn-dependent protease
MRVRIPIAAAAFCAVALPAAAGGEPPDLRTQVEDRLHRGDLAGAREVLAAAPQGDPTVHLARVELLAAEDPRSLDPIETELRAAYAADPTSPAPLVRLGALLRDAGTLDRAEQVIHEGLERFPDDPRLLHALGGVRLARGEAGPAARLLQKAADAAPGDAAIERDLGLALAEAGMSAQALLRLQEARRQAADDLPVREALAGVYRKLDDAPHAAEEEQAVARIQELVGHGERRRIAMRELSARIEDLEARAASGSPPPGTFRELTLLYDRRGDASWNLPRLERLASAQAGAEGRSAAAFARALGGDPQAPKALRAVLADDPTSSLALEGLLRLPPGVVEPAEIVVRARQAADAAPQDVWTALHLGRALWRAGDLDAAAASLRRALAIAPGHPRSAVALSGLLRERGEADEAQRMMAEAVAANPDDPQLLVELGLTALLRGDVDTAAVNLTRAYERGAQHPLLLQYLAGLAAQRGDPIAVAAYNRAARAETGGKASGAGAS